MNRKLIITKIREKIVTAVLEDEKIAEFHCSKRMKLKRFSLAISMWGV